MQKTGKPEAIKSRVGLHFASAPPTKFPLIMYLRSLDIDIPAGASNHSIKDSYVLPVDVKVMAVSPHAHYLAREMQAYAILPSGTRQWLLHIKDWDFYRQEDFHYVEPVLLPRGTGSPHQNFGRPTILFKPVARFRSVA